MHVKFHGESFGYRWPIRLKWRYDFMHNSSVIYLSTGISETCHLFLKQRHPLAAERWLLTHLNNGNFCRFHFQFQQFHLCSFLKEWMRLWGKRDVQMSEFKHKILQKSTNNKIGNFFSMFINKYITWQHNGKIFTLTMYT